MSRSILDPVFDIGRDLQRAYDEGYKQGRYDEKVETETSLPNGEPTHAVHSNTISRRAAINAIADQNEMHPKDRIIAIEVLDGLQSAQPPVLTCDGCRHVGTYDTDFPCSGCIRREKDYYEQER